MSWQLAQTQRRRSNTQMTHSHRSTRPRRRSRHERHKHTGSRLPRRTRNQNCVDYSLVNEQAQFQPHRIHARHQGTQSPQISVTFLHFNSNPFIWCRGPRPRAHWYMHTDGTNYRNRHNYSPLRMSDVLITISSLPGVGPLQGSPVTGSDD